MSSKGELHNPEPVENGRMRRFGQFSFDTEDEILWRGEELISLPPKTCRLLAVFIENAGRLLTKDKLMIAVWQDAFVEEANLSHHIAVLRRALGETRSTGKYIETVPRKGYRFVAPIEKERETLKITVRESTVTQIVEEIDVIPDHDRPRSIKPAKILIAACLVSASLVLAVVFLWSRAPELKQTGGVQRLVPVTAYTGHELGSAISPDGKFVAYSGTNLSTTVPNPNEPQILDHFNIFVKQTDGESALQITNKQGRAQGPAWSADGRFLAYGQLFLPYVDKKSALFVIPAFGGTEQKIAEPIDIGAVGWSPDGETIVFSARPDSGSPKNLYTISIETQDIKQITFGSATEDDHASFSPDGTLIAFVRYKSKTAEIYVLPSAGGQERQVTNDNHAILGAAWTGDGKKLVFGSNRVSGSYQLWQTPVGGGEVTRVNGAGEYAHDPSISADGKRLTYTRMQLEFNIWRQPLQNNKATAEGSGKIVASARQNRCPALSPDGSRISFVSNQNSSARQVWIADADGQNQKQLTNFSDGTITTRTMWSPDGKELAFDAASDGSTSAIYALNVESGVPRKLTDGSTDALLPSWSRDGKYIYFTQKTGVSWEVWKVALNGGAAQQVSSNGGFEAHESPDGQYLYFNKAGYGTIGIFRQPTGGGQGEQLVFDLPQVESFGEWHLTADGIYYLYRTDGQLEAKNPGIRFFNLKAGRSSDVWSFGFNPFGHPGLTVSPDQKWIYYSLNEKEEVDIMLVENFD